jgi:hypothetical protein
LQPEYLTRAQVAAEYPISLSYLEKAKPELGGPPVIRRGRKVLLKRSSFEQWLDSHEQTAIPLPQMLVKRRRGRPTKVEQRARRGER